MRGLNERHTKRFLQFINEADSKSMTLLGDSVPTIGVIKDKNYSVSTSNIPVYKTDKHLYDQMMMDTINPIMRVIDSSTLKPERIEKLKSNLKKMNLKVDENDLSEMTDLTKRIMKAKVIRFLDPVFAGSTWKSNLDMLIKKTGINPKLQAAVLDQLTSDINLASDVIYGGDKKKEAMYNKYGLDFAKYMIRTDKPLTDKEIKREAVKDAAKMFNVSREFVKESPEKNIRHVILMTARDNGITLTPKDIIDATSMAKDLAVGKTEKLTDIKVVAITQEEAQVSGEFSGGFGQSSDGRKIYLKGPVATTFKDLTKEEERRFADYAKRFQGSEGIIELKDTPGFKDFLIRLIALSDRQGIKLSELEFKTAMGLARKYGFEKSFAYAARIEDAQPLSTGFGSGPAGKKIYIGVKGLASVIDPTVYIKKGKELTKEELKKEIEKLKSLKGWK